MKTKLKTRFNIGDKIIIPGCQRGFYEMGEIEEIHFDILMDPFVNQYKKTIRYTISGGTSCCEEDCMTVDEFNEEQRKLGRDYQSYLNWLNKKDYVQGK